MAQRPCCPPKLKHNPEAENYQGVSASTGRQTTATGVSTCHEAVRLADQGADGLRTNFYVNNLLDFSAAKKGAEPGVPCQVCEGNVEGSKSWCVDCAIFMFIAEETLNAEKDMGKFSRKRHCQKHNNQELVFYCDSCKALVCTACTVVDHRPSKDHNPVEIATVAQKRKEMLQRHRPAAKENIGCRERS
ncbi:hypothetical protein Bbelb_399290 [Branchiostoma belcheri]|nr:hypothetical protein Bbelb_399290 [Branchiostoma belcheri]